jgi:hypothetical protein
MFNLKPSSFNLYLCDKRAKQLIIENIFDEINLNEVSCYAYLGQTMIPLNENTLGLRKISDSSDASIISAACIIIKVEKKAA